MMYLIPGIISLAFLGIIFLMINMMKIYYKRKKRRSPFTENFLRAPGQSLLSKIEDINLDLDTYLFGLLFVPLLFYAFYISDRYFGQRPITLSSILLYIVIGLAFSMFFMFKIVKLIKHRRTMRLGYDGEIAVAQELNLMMHQGYFVFHDFVADKFNIDHVVVGSAGVFAVETKTRAKPISNQRSKDAKVTYDGKCLHFPKWKETAPLDQAKHQAVWLEKWLSSATGEKTPVRPVVAIPGWYVTRTSSEGIPVINPKQFRSIAKPIHQKILDDSCIKRVVHQLNSRCKNIESKAVDGLGGSG